MPIKRMSKRLVTPLLGKVRAKCTRHTLKFLIKAEQKNSEGWV